MDTSPGSGSCRSGTQQARGRSPSAPERFPINLYCIRFVRFEDFGAGLECVQEACAGSLGDFAQKGVRRHARNCPFVYEPTFSLRATRREHWIVPNAGLSPQLECGLLIVLTKPNGVAPQAGSPLRFAVGLIKRRCAPSESDRARVPLTASCALDRHARRPCGRRYRRPGTVPRDSIRSATALGAQGKKAAQARPFRSLE